MKLVVGIGNPGPEYAQTRHNCGFMTCDLLAAEHAAAFARHRKWKSQLAELRLADEKVLLLKPQTYVNRSGEAVLAALAFHKLLPEQMLVVTDDINLPLGTLRLRASGSAGGHNGLRDIEARIGRGYPRLRLGIGREDANRVAHVLGRFSPEEQPAADAMLARAVQSVGAWLAAGLEPAMRFNGPPSQPPPDAPGSGEAANGRASASDDGSPNTPDTPSSATPSTRE